MKRFLYFNLYVIKGVDGDILIDTGFIGMKRKLKRWLKKFDIKLVVLTHAHVDHIWNASYIKKLCHCDIAIGELDLENIDNSKISSKPTKDCYRHWTKLMNWGMKKFIPKKFDINILLKDNQVLDKYGIKLKAVSLPGHTNGSIGLLYNNCLFAGDSLVHRKKKVVLAYQNQNVKDSMQSFKKILELSPKIIFVGHDKEIFANELVTEYN